MRVTVCIAWLSLVASSGCEPSFYDFRVYDDLAADTWVHSSTAPEGVGGSAYGVAMAAGGATDLGASFLVAGRLNDGFGRVFVSPQGDVDVTPIDLFTVNTLAQPNGWDVDPVMVSDPDARRIAVSMTNGGTPQDPLQATIAIMDSGTGQTAGLFTLLGPERVRDMAFGLTNVAQTGADNLVAIRSDKLEVIADTANFAAPPVTCAPGLQATMSVVIGEFDSSSPGQEIVFAAGTGLVPSQVFVVPGSLVSDAAATVTPPEIAPCFDVGRQPLLTIDTLGEETDFGASMVVADFNGNGTQDLAIGATQTGLVYVYLDLDASLGQPGLPVVIDGSNRGPDFGATLVAGDVYPGLGDELVVALPDATAEGFIQAGVVTVYEFAGDDFLLPQIVYDAAAEASLGFGRSVAVVPFNQDREILVVGSNEEVYTYFRLRPADPDVRP